MNYLRIDKEDICNGEGLRVVLWLSGCSHKCRGCQNPQTWDANSGIPFDKSAKEELFRELDKDYISGLTLTGGDPLFEGNLDDVLDLVTEINKRYKILQDANRIRLSSTQKSIWLYTGYTWDEIWCNEEIIKNNYGFDYWKKVSNNHKKRQQIVSKCNILIDGRYIDSKRNITLKWCGSSNQRVLDVQNSLKESNIVLYNNS